MRRPYHMDTIASKCYQPNGMHTITLQDSHAESCHKSATIKNPKLMAMSSLNRKVIIRSKRTFSRLDPRSAGKRSIEGSSHSGYTLEEDAILRRQSKSKSDRHPWREGLNLNYPAKGAYGLTIDFPLKNTCTAYASIANDCH